MHYIKYFKIIHKPILLYYLIKLFHIIFFYIYHLKLKGYNYFYVEDYLSDAGIMTKSKNLMEESYYFIKPLERAALDKKTFF